MRTTMAQRFVEKPTCATTPQGPREISNCATLGLGEQNATRLIQSITDYAIYLLDPGGHVISWNPGAKRIKGYEAEEILGKHFSVFYIPEDQAAGVPDRDLLSAAANSYETEAWRVAKDGHRFWAGILVTPLFDEMGSLIAFAKITRDLTERHAAEEERLRLARAEEALVIRNKFLDETKKSLDQTLISLTVHVQALKATIDTLTGETPAGIAAKMTMLEWGLDRMSKAIETVLDSATSADGELVRLGQKQKRV